jgi:UDP-N-acetylglucosamine transferase subunit ALG13
MGYVHKDGKHLPHLDLRQKILDYQKQNNKRTLIADSNLFLYMDKTNPHHYLRYSFDGVFPTTGFYFDTVVNPDRWIKISKNMNISIKPYRTQGNHILICLQRNGGWSMAGLSVIDWLDTTVRKIQQISNRPIVVRTHPGDKKIMRILKLKYKNVALSNKPNLLDDLQNAWTTVVYNSSPSVASIIEGVPAFITDPEPLHSQSYPVANMDLNQIENPALHERQQWIEKLAMCHWNFEELRSGEAWSFFKRYI